MTRCTIAALSILLFQPIAAVAQRPYESTTTFSARRTTAPRTRANTPAAAMPASTAATTAPRISVATPVSTAAISTSTLPSLAATPPPDLPNLYSEVPTTSSVAAYLASEPSLSISSTSATLYSDTATPLPTVPELEITLLPDDILMELDTTASEAFSAFHRLPETPLPVEELDDLTSNSPRARRITLHQSVCRVLECNQEIHIEKLRPEISNTGIESAESEFDTRLTAGVDYETQHTSTLGPRSRDGGDRPPEEERVSRRFSQNVGIAGRLPTGTDYSIGFTNSRSWSNTSLPFYSQALNLNITQNLLRGAGCEVNMVRVWQAENNFVASLYQLQQFLINIVTETMNTYWDVYLALRTLEIARNGHEVAREQRRRTEEFVEVGKSPPLELLAAQAEESQRVSQVIVAASNLKRQQLLFNQLLNPELLPRGYTTLVYPAEDPVLPSESVIVKERLRLAMYYRPDLRQAELDLSNSELEVIRTENGLLPALDLTGGLSFAGSGDHFGQANKKIREFEFPSYGVGLQFSYPLQNRAARAAYRRSMFQEELARQAIDNFQQVIESDIRLAINEIERTTRLIDSTEITRMLREQELAAEIEKFRVGRSTQLLVAQAQRDLIQSQLDEVSAEVANIKSYISLYRAEGTTLQRLGITPICITPESGVGSH